jgi:hypothetical protein
LAVEVVVVSQRLYPQAVVLVAVVRLDKMVILLEALAFKEIQVVVQVMVMMAEMDRLPVRRGVGDHVVVVVVLMRMVEMAQYHILVLVVQENYFQLLLLMVLIHQM